MKLSSVLKIFVFANIFIVLSFEILSAQNLDWAKQITGSQIDEGRSITVDSFGNVYTVDSFVYTADFDQGIGIFYLNSVGGADIYISKSDVSGNFVWARQFVKILYT